jgi:translocator protein
MNNNLKFIVSLLIPLSIGAVAGYFTSSAIGGWYSTLVKPSFNPPNNLFGPVWTGLYLLMGIACYLIWKSDNANKKKALQVYALQLLLNFLWSFFFFYFKNPALAFVDIILMLITIAITIKLFYSINKTAAYLLVPYILWVSFATALNFSIWQLN